MVHVCDDSAEHAIAALTTNQNPAPSRVNFYLLNRLNYGTLTTEPQ